MKSHLSTLALLSALAGQLQAASQPPGLPSGAQYGAFNFPLKCTVAKILHQTFNGVITATAPLIASPGQEIYLTEATAQLTVPSSIIYDLFPLLGIKQAQAVVKTTLSVTNASPSTVDIFPDAEVVNGISLPFGQNIVVNVPSQAGAAIPDIGPITLGPSNGTQSTISLGAFDIKLNLQTASGKTVLPNVPITCDVQDPAVQLATINIEGPPSQPPLRIDSGGARTFPAIPESSELGSFRFPYSCDIGQLGAFDLDLSVTGAVTSFLAPGQQFHLDSTTTFINLPQIITQLAPVLFPGTVAFRTSLNQISVTASNANPAAVNALATPVTVVSPIQNGTASIPVPPTGSLQIGPFTAANALGQLAVIGVGATNGSTQLLDKDNNVLATYTVNCPNSGVQLISLPIAAAASSSSSSSLRGRYARRSLYT